MTKQLAVLRTYNDFYNKAMDYPVLIDENHDFSIGPYQDTVPFSVGNNQSILSIDLFDKEEIENMYFSVCRDREESLYSEKYSELTKALVDYLYNN